MFGDIKWIECLEYMREYGVSICVITCKLPFARVDVYIAIKSCGYIFKIISLWNISVLCVCLCQSSV